MLIYFPPNGSQQTSLRKEERNDRRLFDQSLTDWYEDVLPPESKRLAKFRRQFVRWAMGLKVEKARSPVREELLGFYHHYGILPGPLMRYIAMVKWGHISKALLTEVRAKLGGNVVAEMKSARGRRKIIRQLNDTRKLVAKLKHLVPSPKRNPEEWQQELNNIERGLGVLAQRVTSAREFKALFPTRGRPDNVMIKFLLNNLAAYIQKVTGEPVDHYKRNRLAKLVTLAVPEMWNPKKPETVAKKWIRSSAWEFPN